MPFQIVNGRPVWVPYTINGGAPMPLSPAEQAQRDSDYWQTAQQTPMGIANQTAYDEARTRFQAIQDREYQLQLDQLKRQRDADAATVGYQRANLEYQNRVLALSKKRQEQEAQQFNVTASGYMPDGSPTMAREQFQTNTLTGLINTAAQLNGPANYGNYLAQTRGVASNIGSIPGLAWTQGGQVGNQTFTGSPQVKSLNSILGDMGIGTGAAGAAAGGGMGAVANGTIPGLGNFDQQIFRTADEFARNPQGAAAGWYESQDPMTKELLQSAATKQGHDWSSVMGRYNMSRWGGGGSAAAA